MTDIKARRVSLSEYHSDWWVERVDGTHALVPVEVWEGVVGALQEIMEQPHDKVNAFDIMHSIFDITYRALAEIGGDDG